MKHLLQLKGRSSVDPKKIAAELQFYKDHPHFEEKPASILEFLGPGYLNIEKGIRAGVKQELVDIFGKEVNPERIALVQEAIFTGAIGIGKTTLASIVIPYMCHWVLCLENPQEFYELLPGSRIAFMQMSTSGDQAKEVVFGDIKARIDYCLWFKEKYPPDPGFKNQLRFEKNIWVLPGDSSETTFEGYNILGGILDEADSHKITENKDYAEQGYDTIYSRVESRFEDRGFTLIIGQMKSSSGFAKRKYDEFRTKPNAHTLKLTIWESRGWERYLDDNGHRDSFWYDVKRKNIIPQGAGQMIGGQNDNVLEIPNMYRGAFENNPEKALRDLAGIPPAAGDPFISLTYKLEEARDRWQERYDNLGSPVDDSVTRPSFADWFVAHNNLKRVSHIDIGYSSEGDGAGIVVGHIAEVVEDDDGDKKPYIVIDCMYRVHAPPGNEIFIGDLRRVLYELRDDRKFNIKKVTMDGFQSTDTKQILRKRRFQTEIVSIDKSMLPYEDLRDAIYENRIEFPPYITHLHHGDVNTVEIAIKELSELEHDTKKHKIDHPPLGSKDVADGLAGVVTELMGDRAYRRKVSSMEAYRQRRESEEEQIAVGAERPASAFPIPGIGGQGGLHAPIPPQISIPGLDQLNPYGPKKKR